MEIQLIEQDQTFISIETKSNQHIYELSLLENLARRNLNAKEKELHIKRLRDFYKENPIKCLISDS